MYKCVSGVKDGLGKIHPCGQPATQVVSVGALVCRYCDTHAERAKEFVARVGNAKIADAQHRSGLT